MHVARGSGMFFGLVIAALLAPPAAAEEGPAGAAAPPAAEPPASRRVTATLAVKGHVFGLAGGGEEQGRQPITMRAEFAFLETPQPATAAAAVLRRYDEAAATIEVDGAEQRLALPDDARSIAVARLGTTPQPFLADAALTRTELELLETPFDSILLEDLLPGRPVDVDDRWTLPGDLAAGLLAIDTVEAGSLEARVVEIATGVAVVALAGVVDGAVDGVPTHVVVDVSFAVAAEPDEDGHVLTGDVTRLDCVLVERRQAGHVAAGFDVEARLTVTRAEAAGVAVEPGDAALRAGGRRGPGGPGRVWHPDPEGRYELVHDAGWRCVEEDAGGLVLRLLDLGALVAQCSITALPRAAGAVAPPVDEVQRHVERSLSGQFKRFDGAAETVRRDDGVRVVRVASEGTAEGLPFRWVHYVLTDDAGRRVHATFMLEASLARRFGDADARLVSGLRIGGGPEREARLPPKTGTP